MCIAKKFKLCLYCCQVKPLLNKIYMQRPSLARPPARGPSGGCEGGGQGRRRAINPYYCGEMCSAKARPTGDGRHCACAFSGDITLRGNQASKYCVDLGNDLGNAFDKVARRRHRPFLARTPRPINTHRYHHDNSSSSNSSSSSSNNGSSSSSSSNDVGSR